MKSESQIRGRIVVYKSMRKAVKEGSSLAIEYTIKIDLLSWVIS